LNKSDLKSTETPILLCKLEFGDRWMPYFSHQKAMPTSGLADLALKSKIIIIFTNSQRKFSKSRENVLTGWDLSKEFKVFES